jgi:glycosyltransferase involved in cell wall biosynthesis
MEDPVPLENLPPKLAAADALLLITASDHLTAVPRKLYDYLGVGRPILALTGASEVARIVHEINGGEIASASDPDQIATALKRIIDSKPGTYKFNGVDKYMADRAAEHFFSAAGISF